MKLWIYEQIKKFCFLGEDKVKEIVNPHLSGGFQFEMKEHGTVRVLFDEETGMIIVYLGVASPYKKNSGATSMERDSRGNLILLELYLKGENSPL